MLITPRLAALIRNIVPRILLVKGSFRIVFRAKRNIGAWEELLFDDGEDFDIGNDVDTGKASDAATKTSTKNQLGREVASLSVSPTEKSIPQEGIADEPTSPLIVLDPIVQCWALDVRGRRGNCG